MKDEDLPPSPGVRALRPTRPRRPWFSRLLLFTACVVALDALVGERSLLQAVRAGREVDRARRELGELRRQNDALRVRVRHLLEDARTIEGVARGDLGLIRRGEILVMLADTPRP